jgi:hypothetical protein
MINMPVVEPPPKTEAQQSDTLLWHPTTETDVELLGNVSTTLRDRLEEHRHFYDALHMVPPSSTWLEPRGRVRSCRKVY